MKVISKCFWTLAEALSYNFPIDRMMMHPVSIKLKKETKLSYIDSIRLGIWT